MVIVCDGNSLTLGTRASDAAHSYPSQLQGLISGSAVTNKGVIAQTWDDMLADVVTDIDPLLGANTWVVVWEDTNFRYFGGTVANSLARTVTYTAGRQALAGRPRVALLTTIPRTDGGTPGGWEAGRVTYNATVVASPLTYADLVVNLAADSRLSDSTNLTYFHSDLVHLVDAGYLVVAQLTAAAINAYVAPGGVSRSRMQLCM